MGFLDGFFGIFQTKQAKLEKKPEQPNHGASWNAPSGVKNPFPASLNAYAHHGYLYAAVNRVIEDLSALDLRLYQGKGKDAKEITDHALIDLLEQPSLQVDGFLFREQVTLDLILSGSCYILLLGPNEQPDSIIRLHPDEVKIVTDQTGIVGYEHTSSGSTVVYPPERVVTGRNASYAKGTKGLYGTGAIEPLNKELAADLNAQKLASQASSQGHPSVLIAPKDVTDIWPEETRRAISDRYNKLARSGGALTLSGTAEVTPLNLSPKDMEFQAVRTMAMQVISATIGVAPTILGLPSANYATARQSALVYWSIQQKRAKRIEIMLNQIAKLYGPDLYFKHDFSSVEVLQDLKNAQLERVVKLVELGIPVRKAMAFENIGEGLFEDEQQDSERFNLDEKSAGTIIKLFEAQERKATPLQEDVKKKSIEK